LIIWIKETSAALILALVDKGNGGLGETGWLEVFFQ
jgi:hypothetical protein